MYKKIALVFTVCFMLVTACVTVNIYFPAEAVRRAADEIVDDVYESDDAVSLPVLLKTAWAELRTGAMLTGLFVETAFAQDVDIDINTPAISAIRSSLEGRSPLLRPYYTGGNIGITNRGYLEIRSMTGLDVKSQADLKGLVNADNNDRKNLYYEIAVANSFGSEAVPQIETLFADSWRTKASPGWVIQNDDGSWTTK
ncbi:MAG: DUF1318 domain-containing protein [Deltaproteobacteria bacterium]|nr:DUF1318 domain-containing protein [Candidatus Zymogenaceae bacterium]